MPQDKTFLPSRDFRPSYLGMRFNRPLFPLLVVSLVSLLLAACSGPDDADAAQGAAEPGADGGAPTTSSEPSVATEGGVTTVQMTGNDRMKFNVTEFKVKAGHTVRLVFNNVGKMPKSAMGHNVVFLKADADVNAFITASAQAKDNDFVPPNADELILAQTRMLGPGESDTIEFTAPEPGEYEYICSFPGHAFAGMRGIMTVTP